MAQATHFIMATVPHHLRASSPAPQPPAAAAPQAQAAPATPKAPKPQAQATPAAPKAP